jgi:hypothetical protein
MEGQELRQADMYLMCVMWSMYSSIYSNYCRMPPAHPARLRPSPPKASQMVKFLLFKGVSNKIWYGSQAISIDRSFFKDVPLAFIPNFIQLFQPFPAEMQVSLHTKKFKQIPSLCHYLLTDFFDLKTVNSLTETAIQCWHCWLSTSKSVQPDTSTMARIFISPSYAKRNLKFVGWKFLFNNFQMSKWFITHIVTFQKRI